MRILFVHVGRLSIAMADRRHDFPITLLLKVSGCLFSELRQEEHVKTKFEPIRQNFLFCGQTASCTVSALKITLLGV